MIVREILPLIILPLAQFLTEKYRELLTVWETSYFLSLNSQRLNNRFSFSSFSPSAWNSPQPRAPSISFMNSLMEEYHTGPWQGWGKTLSNNCISTRTLWVERLQVVPAVSASYQWMWRGGGGADGREGEKRANKQSKCPKCSGYGFKFSIFSNYCFPGLKWVKCIHIIMKYFDIEVWNICTIMQLYIYV